jgi:hypothetical protein
MSAGKLRTPKISDITEKWSQLTPAQKKAINSAASAVLADPNALKRVKKSLKRKKTPTLRTPSAYILFAKQKRSQLKKKNPDISFQDMGRQLGELWAQATEEEKAKFQKESKAASPFKRKAKVQKTSTKKSSTKTLTKKKDSKKKN